MADNRLQLGITITADGKAAEQALGKVQASLQQTKRAAKETSDAWARLSAVGSAKLASITAAQNLTKGMSAAGAAARQAAAEAERMRRGVGLLSSALDTSTTSLAGYAKGLAGLFVAYRSVRIAAQAMMAAVNAAAQLDRLKSGMIAASGGAAAAASNLQFVEHTAKTLGINLLAAQEGFVGLTAAARGTALQGQATQEIFSAVARASAALGKSSEDTQGILNALGQMISKGTVQMEELRGQLGDRLPGAFQIAARAMGMSTAELDKFVTQGNLTATEFLPKFAKALDDAYSSARFDKINNNIERVDTAWTKFKANIVDTDSISKAIGHVASLLDGLNTLVSKSKAYGEAFNVIPSKSAVDLALTGGKTGLQPIATEDVTGGFKAIEKGAYDAMLSVTKLNDAQKAVAALVIDTAKAYKVDPAWALAIAQQESGFNQLAKSAAGAQGVMQLMPGTAKQLGVNIADVNDNIKGGVAYLRQQQEQFKSLKLASAAYNAGPGNVTKYGGVPPFKETQAYVQSVGAMYQKWQQVLGVQGEAFVSARDQADELKTAYESLKTHQDGMVSAAENFAKVQVEKIKTSLTALEAERKATQDVATAQLASVRTYDDKQAILAKIASQQDDYNRRAADLAREEIDTQQQVIETRKRALETELASADKYNLTTIEQAKIKQAIADADADLAVLAQQRAQAEIAAGQAVSEASKQSAALRQDEQNAIAAIIAQYEREVEVLNRLTQAKQAGAGADQLRMLGQYYEQSRQLPEIVSQDQLQKLKQYQLSIAAIKDAIGDMTKSTDDVREAQLRQNAIWEQTIQRIEQAASAWNELTNGQSRGIDRMLVSLAKFGQSIDQIGQKYAELAKAGKSTDALGQTQFSETAKATAQAIGETTLGLRGMFKVGSDGYKAMTAGATAALVAQDLLNISDGIAAVLKQLKEGDPYTASVRAAIVAAQVASMGVHIAGGISAMGSSSANRAAEQQAKTGTGSVLGDSSAQSLSISRSIDLIAQNTSTDLNYSAAMLRALQNIESALLGASSLIFRSVLPSIKSDIGNSGLDFGMKKISLFSGFDKQVTDAGIGQVAAQSLRSILKSGFKTLAKYADITDSFKVLGMELSSSTKTYIRSLDADVTGQFNRVIKGMADALMEGGKAFGLTADDFNTRLAKFKVDIGKLSLKDLSSEEAQKQIEAAFSKVFDGMADALSVGLGKFKRAGEGAAETFFRVAEGIQRATGELAQLGMQAIEYREIVNKQGDVSAEIARQTIYAQGLITDGLKGFLDTITESSGEVIDAYKKLLQIQQSFSAAFNVEHLDKALIDAAGGLDKFVASMQSFNDAYLTQADTIAAQLAGLGAQFELLGQQLPNSKAEFLALMQSIDTSTEAGKQLFGALLQLADGFAKVKDSVQSIKDKYADILNPMGKYGAQIDAVINDFNVLIADAVAPIKASLEKLIDPWKATLKQDQADLTKFQDLRVKALQDIDAWQKELDELSAKPNKNKKRIAELRDWIADAKRRVDSYDLAISAITDEIASLQQAIADAIAKGAIDEAKAKSELLAQAGTVMFKTLEDIWDQLTAGVQKGKDYLAALQDQILQLQGDIGGPSVILDNAKYKEQLAKGALNSYTGGDATVEIDLIKRVQDAVMARYQAELDIINQRAQALKDEQAALQQEQSRLDGLVSQLTSQLDSIQGVITSIADAIAELDASLSGNAVDYAIKKYDYAQQAITQYLNALANGTPRDIDRELKLIQDMQNAVMARYQAELADIQRITDAQVKALTDERDARQKAHDEQIDALQKEMEAARKLSDAVKSIAEYAQRLKLGAFSDLSPERKLAEANRQYQDLLTKANAGDADAIANMANASDAYLQAAKDYYGSGSQYSTILSGVQQAMESLGAMKVTDPDSIQARIDELNAAHAEYLKSIDARIADLNDPEKNAAIKALRERTIADLQALQGYADKTAKLIDQRLVEAREQAAANQAKLDEVNAKLAALNTDEEIKALKERTVIELQALQQKLIDATALAAEQAKEQFQTLIQKAIDANVLSQQQIDLLRAMATQMGATPAYARGGYAPAGMALVGERGPELVRFERPAQVMTAEQTRRILTPKDDAQIAQAIGELKAEMRAVVVTQSGANPQIIAELREMRGRLEAIERTNRVKS